MEKYIRNGWIPATGIVFAITIGVTLPVMIWMESSFALLNAPWVEWIVSMAICCTIQAAICRLFWYAWGVAKGD